MSAWYQIVICDDAGYKYNNNKKKNNKNNKNQLFVNPWVCLLVQFSLRCQVRDVMRFHRPLGPLDRGGIPSVVENLPSNEDERDLAIIIWTHMLVKVQIMGKFLGLF